MKFGVQFDFHKIPEWYGEYLDYNLYKAIIEIFEEKVSGTFL